MKLQFYFFILTLCLPFLFISCEEKVEGVQVTFLLLSERNDGTTFLLNLETGELEEYGEFDSGGDDVTGIRGMVYHPSTNRVYAGQNSNAGGFIYEFFVPGRTATVFNDNDDGNGNMEWYGIADMTVGPNDEILATTWDMVTEEPTIVRFDTEGVRGDNLEFDGASPCCGLGITTYENNLLIGDFRQFHEVSFGGVIERSQGISGEFDPIIEITATFIQNLTWLDGTLYALIFDANNQLTYVVILDPETGEMTQVSEALEGRYHGLVAAPDLAFR